MHGGLDYLLRFAALEDDGNGMAGERWRQRFQTGKGFGTEGLQIIGGESALLRGLLIGYVRGAIAAAEQEAGHLVFIATAKEGVPVVEQDGGVIGHELVFEN